MPFFALPKKSSCASNNGTARDSPQFHSPFGAVKQVSCVAVTRALSSEVLPASRSLARAITYHRRRHLRAALPSAGSGKRSANGCRAARERGGNRTSPSTSRPVAVTSSPCAAPWRWAPPGRLGWCAAGRRTSCTGAACAAGPAPRCTGSRVTSPLLRIGVVLR